MNINYYTNQIIFKWTSKSSFCKNLTIISISSMSFKQSISDVQYGRLEDETLARKTGQYPFEYYWANSSSYATSAFPWSKLCLFFRNLSLFPNIIIDGNGLSGEVPKPDHGRLQYKPRQLLFVSPASGQRS